MTIVIPMAGLSKRFIDAGFTLPKYMLYVGTQSVFNITVSSFKKYFASKKFLFIIRNIFDTKNFIENECRLIGIKKYEIIILDSPTKGQADTVYQGVTSSKVPDNESMLIFNIDTIRHDYSFPEELIDCDGYLEVFKGTGANWSYAEPADEMSTLVKRTAEKVEISNLCSTGLYYFKKKSDFCQAYQHSQDHLLKEHYISPLYNYLIKDGRRIHYYLIRNEDVAFTGIPSEYMNLLRSRIK